MDDMFLYHASHLFEHWLFCAHRHMHVCIMMDDVYIYHAHNFSFVFVLCRYSCILVNLSIPRVDETSSWEQRRFGIPWIVLPTILFAQRLRASLSLGSHTAMGYIPLVASCSFYRVHFACYAYFYAFAMQLWPLRASTHDSPLCYSYVYLHAWWRSLLLLPCLSCAPCYWYLLCSESHDDPLLFTYGFSSIHWCYFANILLPYLWYVMCIMYAHHLHTWHSCHDYSLYVASSHY